MSITMTPQDLQSMMSNNPNLLMKMLQQNPLLKLVIANDETAVEADQSEAIVNQVEGEIAPGGAIIAAEAEPGVEEPMWQAAPAAKRSYRVASEYSPPEDVPESSSVTSSYSYSSSSSYSHSYNAKTKLCYHFEKHGHCDDGARCNYAHGKHELKTHPNYKTRMCQYYSTNSCSNGMRCHFAHSRAELRQ